GGRGCANRHCTDTNPGPKTPKSLPKTDGPRTTDRYVGCRASARTQHRDFVVSVASRRWSCRVFLWSLHNGAVVACSMGVIGGPGDDRAVCKQCAGGVGNRHRRRGVRGYLGGSSWCSGVWRLSTVGKPRCGSSTPFGNSRRRPERGSR